MNFRHSLAGAAALALVAAGTLLAQPATAQSSMSNSAMSNGAMSNGAMSGNMSGGAPSSQSIVPQSEQVTLQAKIAKIDMKTRTITLEAPDHEKLTVVAGPMVRLDQLKAGDTVNAQYYRSVAFAIQAGQGGNGTPTADNSLQAVLARPATGPGGVLIAQAKLQGTVVAIDLEAHRVSLVNPSGGRVYVFDVTDPARQAMLPKLQVGDTVTAVVSEMFAVSVSPAKKRWW